MAVVFRIKSIFDTLSFVLGASTILLIVLVVLLSIRIRSREIQTIHRIGCSRFAVVFLYTYELGTIVAVSAVLAAITSLAAGNLVPDLIRML